MPNWCDDRLRLSGPNEVLAAFALAVADPSQTDPDQRLLSFARHVPVPEEIEEKRNWDRLFEPRRSLNTFPPPDPDWGPNRVAAYMATAIFPIMDGHLYRIALWGSKWEPGDVRRFGPTRRRLAYRFSTANSAPIAWLIAVARAYPELVFDLTYWEPSCASAGQVRLSGERWLIDVSFEHNVARLLRSRGWSAKDWE